MTATEPITVAHLGHVELLTDKPDASLDFFTRVFGLTESGREGDSVYLRAYDDYEFHTLKLTAAKTTGSRHVAYRAASPQALERRVKALEQMGCGLGWHDGDLGHGPAYRFRDPDDHVFEIYYETRRYEAPPGEKPSLKNQAQRFHGRGVATRRLDHVNLMAAELGAIRDFMPKALGSRITEQVVLDNGKSAAAGSRSTTRPMTSLCARQHRQQRALSPRHLRRRPARAHPAGGRHFSGERRFHRDRAAQARDPADLLHLCVGAGRQPHRTRQCRRAPDPGAGLADRHLDRGRAPERPGLGAEDHRVVSHPRHAAGG